MNGMINFVLESGISLSVLAIVYVLFLRKETFFRLNRIFLLGSVLFSVVLPFLHFQVFRSTPIMLSEITVTPYRNLLAAVTIYGKDLSGSIEEVVLSANLIVLIYLVGVVFFTIRFLVRVLKISILVLRHEVRYMDDFKLVVLEGNSSPFSFMSCVFVAREQLEEDYYESLIVHELEHVRQGHTLDVIILEVLSILQWFNPFLWMLRTAITENHEYLADEAVLKAGANRGSYKKLLLHQYVGQKFEIANHFNYSLIKKRIVMMSRLRSTAASNIKVAFGILAAALLVVFFACDQRDSFTISSDSKAYLLDQTRETAGSAEDMNKFSRMVIGNISYEIAYDTLGNIVLTKTDEIQKADSVSSQKTYEEVEMMPEFPGGEMAMREYISNLIRYPVSAIERGEQGKVQVVFVVRRDGLVTNASIEKGVSPAIDKEALRVVSSLPRWKPGYHDGKPVNVSYTVSINFSLDI